MPPAEAPPELARLGFGWRKSAPIIGYGAPEAAEAGYGHLALASSGHHEFALLAVLGYSGWAITNRASRDFDGNIE
jgi:hypothetical protein